MVGFSVITCLLYLQYLEEEDGQCSCKLRKIISSPFSSPFFLYGISFYQQRQREWFLTLEWFFKLCSVSSQNRRWLLPCMGTKMKGIYKYISNIFVVKEREIEIGFPTDVKHVAHIGWDGQSGNAPTWMNEFKTGPDFAATGSAHSPWASQDFTETTRQQPASPSMVAKKQKRRKPKAVASPRSGSSSSSRSSRAEKSKAKFVEGNAKPANIEVA